MQTGNRQAGEKPNFLSFPLQVFRKSLVTGVFPKTKILLLSHKHRERNQRERTKIHIMKLMISNAHKKLEPDYCY